MPNPTRRIVALAVLAAAIAAAAALELAPVAAQSDDETGRIVAQRLADGRTEFGWQPAGAARVLPRARYFPTDARVDRWLNSSPVEVGGAEIGRINARLRSDGRIEFAFTPTDGERILPPSRYFPVDARVGRWLRSTEITISAAPAAGFVAISSYRYHSCAIRESGAIECWGDNDAGQTNAPAGRFSAVATGEFHTCSIRESDSAIECWGVEEITGYWQVDNGQIATPPGPFSAVAAGSFHTCAIRAGSGAIVCWGSNRVGQTDTPAGSFTAIAAGNGHNCALHESGAIQCWGRNDYGLDDAPAGRFTAISAGNFHTCAVRDTSEIVCWGDNIEGQVSDAPAGRFTAISAGGAHTCAIRESDSAIECWGNNSEQGEWNDETRSPEKVYGGQTDAPAGSFTAVATGDAHSCAIRESGAIECWGGNNHVGQTDPPAP